MSLYSVLISFAHDLHYKMLWVCSSWPLELHFVLAWYYFQQDSGSTWRLHGKWKLLENLSSTSLNIPMGNENELKKSCLLKQDYDCPHRLGCCVSLNTGSHQAHRCMFAHFRPPVIRSIVSWFCCMSRCRLVSSRCWLTCVPLELRRPSPRTPSPKKKCHHHLIRLFPLITKALQHLHVGWRVFICGHGHRATTWRTMGQKLTYVGLARDARAKMQYYQ